MNSVASEQEDACNGGVPVGLDVVGSPKQLDLARSWREALDDSVDFVRLVTRRPHLHNRPETVTDIYKQASLTKRRHRKLKSPGNYSLGLLDTTRN